MFSDVPSKSDQDSENTTNPESAEQQGGGGENWKAMRLETFKKFPPQLQADLRGSAITSVRANDFPPRFKDISYEDMELALNKTENLTAQEQELMESYEYWLDVHIDKWLEKTSDALQVFKMLNPKLKNKIQQMAIDAAFEGSGAPDEMIESFRTSPREMDDNPECYYRFINFVSGEMNALPELKSKIQAIRDIQNATIYGDPMDRIMFGSLITASRQVKMPLALMQSWINAPGEVGERDADTAQTYSVAKMLEAMNEVYRELSENEEQERFSKLEMALASTPASLVEQMNVPNEQKSQWRKALDFDIPKDARIHAFVVTEDALDFGKNESPDKSDRLLRESLGAVRQADKLTFAEPIVIGKLSDAEVRVRLEQEMNHDAEYIFVYYNIHGHTEDIESSNAEVSVRSAASRAPGKQHVMTSELTSDEIAAFQRAAVSKFPDKKFVHLVNSCHSGQLMDDELSSDPGTAAVIASSADNELTWGNRFGKDVLEQIAQGRTVGEAFVIADIFRNYKDAVHTEQPNKDASSYNPTWQNPKASIRAKDGTFDKVSARGEKEDSLKA